MTPTLYLVVTGTWPDGDLTGVACTETEVLWHHTSSNEAWLRRDLTDGFPGRLGELRHRFPDGYVVDFVAAGHPLPVQIAGHFRRVTSSVTFNLSDGTDASA